MQSAFDKQPSIECFFEQLQKEYGSLEKTETQKTTPSSTNDTLTDNSVTTIAKIQQAKKKFGKGSDKTVDRGMSLSLIPFEQVCVSHPPYVSGLVVKILNELDKRMPCLANLDIGGECVKHELSARLDNLIVHCQRDRDLPNYYFSMETSNTLCCLLKLFLERLPAFPFLASNELIQAVKKRQPCHRCTLEKHSQCEEVLYLIMNCCRRMNQFQLSTVAFIMAKFHYWIRKEIAFSLYFNRNRPTYCWENIYLKSVDKLTEKFGIPMIGLKRNQLWIDELKDSSDIPLLKKRVFNTILATAPFEFWHLESIVAMNYNDRNCLVKTYDDKYLPKEEPETNLCEEPEKSMERKNSKSSIYL